jgi:hypothetical protein
MSTQETGLILSALPQTKKDLDIYCEQVKELTLSGEIDIVDVAKKINIMGRVVEYFEKDKSIQESLLNEAEKYGKGERTDLHIREVGVKYDFHSCNHSTYNRLYEEKKQIEARLKEIEATLKVRDVSEIDTETGEIIEATKAVKSSTTKCIILIK